METIRFGFYGRVSTEDNQDPESSRAWQITRSRALIEPRGGVIVAEFFDVDKSRSIPWQRRPQAMALLGELRNPGRGFGAVVIGEPHRAFYGNQYGLTFPIFEHFGVSLWVPEVGGPIDPANEAHDLVMSVFGGMSKGERNRVKVRVRSAMGAQAQMEGRFLGGRPPYGYVLVDAGPHPNPAKAADGRRLHRLDLDPIAWHVVARIFAEYVAGFGFFAIAERLTRDGIASPSAHDPGRNRHRCGVAWSKSAVRAILTNPRYTGYEVWNKQRKDEVLLDVDDVGLGHTTKQRWNPKDEWIWSDQPAHPPIVSREDFEAVQATMAGRGDKHTDKTMKRARNIYQFRGLIRCRLCTRRMQGDWINEMPYYRCRFAREYALANHVAHPRNVLLREIDLAPKLDEYLGKLFTPWNIDRTLDLLAQGRQTQVPVLAEKDSLDRQLAECDRKLKQYRAALDAGADAVTVAGWMNEEQSRRSELQRRIDRLPVADQRRFDRDALATVLHELGDMVKVLRNADPARKAKIYANLGLELTFDPGNNEVLVAAVSNQDSHWVPVRVRGGT
ncbi:recombinase family protein [Nonomuraea sp. NPDC050547]|uniref:recombinase family protein n=1 Tax=Nonomuraea sp. NPDC050547 TaxID=3364368 RepID=UPI0037B2FC93